VILPCNVCGSGFFVWAWTRGSGRVAVFLILMLSTLEAPAEVPRNVLLLYSFGADIAPWSETTTVFRAALDKQLTESINFYDASVFGMRFDSPPEQAEAGLVEYLRELFSTRKLALVVTTGAPAAHFVQRNRFDLFAGVPAVFGGLDPRLLADGSLTTDDTVVGYHVELPAYMENILRVRPETTSVAVVIGNTPLERYWVSEMRREFQPFSNRVSVVWWNELTFDDMLIQAAALTPKTAILYQFVMADAAGVSQPRDRVFAPLRAVATAPLFGFGDYHLGRGAVGGPLAPQAEQGRAMASAAVRILNGESPSAMKFQLPYAPPRYDWRELQRWGINESRLPPGSIVDFREPTAWERYRWQILLTGIALLGQSLLIAGLLHARRRRHLAEVETRQRTVELARMNRRAIAGQMSASIAHEVNQPLTAILAYAEALQNLLTQKNLDLGKIREVVTDIISEDTRASEVVGRIRRFLRRDGGKSQPVDLNDLVRSTLHLLHGDITKRKLSVETVLAENLPAIAGDVVQLQQVLINLVFNAMDAVESKPLDRRLVKIATRANGKYIEADIADSGHGILADNQPRLFEPFFTTKEHGLGLGLPICSTIVKAHGGKLTLRNNDDGGATAALSLLPADT
jgi:signal transduction histidine kinase